MLKNNSRKVKIFHLKGRKLLRNKREQGAGSREQGIGNRE